MAQAEKEEGAKAMRSTSQRPFVALPGSLNLSIYAHCSLTACSDSFLSLVVAEERGPQ